MARHEGPAVPAPSMREAIGDFDVVSADAWSAAREKLLAEEKALMTAKDRLAAKRRRLPVTEVDRHYRFTGTRGDRDLLGLFEGRRQLIVYRFLYAPDVENWPDGACSGCSLFDRQLGTVLPRNDGELPAIHAEQLVVQIIKSRT